MLVYAGIDEAGYGPMLGPLCVACAAFVLDEYDPARGAPDLWSILDKAVCREKRDPRKRIVVDDSKKLKGSNTSKRVHPLKYLERSVLAFTAADGSTASSDDALFDHLGVSVDDRPWYRSSTPLPLAHTVDELRITARRLERGMETAGARCELLCCEAIDAAALNEGVAQTGRKSAVNLAAALRLLDTIWRRWPECDPRVIIDRQGGRTHYLRELQLAYPGAHLRILAEGEEVSRYRLEQDGSSLTVSFTRSSEDRHLPAALASMVAKYVRELFMIRLNRFFTGRMPELKPTAGYVQDGRRYVRDIEPLIRDLELPRRDLVRSV